MPVKEIQKGPGEVKGRDKMAVDDSHPHLLLSLRKQE
jgi:hypothetical protein